MLDFPSAPVNGQVYEGYVFNNGVWTIESSGNSGVQGIWRVVNRNFIIGSSVWTIDPKSAFWEVFCIGGGGAGGGAAATAAAQCAAGAGGMTGGFYGFTINRSIYPDTNTWNVTVGTGGVGVAGANGGNGTNSSISGLTSGGGAGGYGGIAGTAKAAPFFTPNTMTISGGGNGYRGGYSQRGQPGICLSATICRGGDGAASPFLGNGMGGHGSADGGAAQASSASAGGGASNLASQAARPGGNGATGRVYVFEYCEA